MISFSSKNDYRGILLQVWERRRQKNPSYSQRAFARDLGMGSARLNEVLGGKQGLSRKSAVALSKVLRFSESDASYFCDLVTAQHGRGASERAAAKARLALYRQAIRYQQLSSDRFRLISEWFNLAIIELAKLASFESSAAWIAKMLGVSEAQIKEALARLERLGVLRRAARGWEFEVSNCQIPGGAPSEAIKSFHVALLDKAKAALFEQPVAEREFVTLMLALDQRRLPELKDRINAFWKTLDAEFGGDATSTHLYAFGMQLFGLSKAGCHD